MGAATIFGAMFGKIAGTVATLGIAAGWLWTGYGWGAHNHNLGLAVGSAFAGGGVASSLLISIWRRNAQGS